MSVCFVNISFGLKFLKMTFKKALKCHTIAKYYLNFEIIIFTPSLKILCKNEK